MEETLQFENYSWSNCFCICLLSSSGWSAEHWLYLISIRATSGLWASVTFSCAGVCPSLLQLQPLSASLVLTEEGQLASDSLTSFHLPIATARNKCHLIWLCACDRALTLFILDGFPWSLHCSAQPVTVLSLNFTSWPFALSFLFTCSSGSFCPPLLSVLPHRS